MFATPGHNHPVSDHPVPIDLNNDHKDDFVSTLRNDGEFLEEPVAAPAADPAGKPHQGVWVVTHRDHKRLNVFDTSVPSSYLEWDRRCSDHRTGELLRCRDGAAGGP
jgi:hypothetical protein